MKELVLVKRDKPKRLKSSVEKQLEFTAMTHTQAHIHAHPPLWSGAHSLSKTLMVWGGFSVWQQWDIVHRMKKIFSAIIAHVMMKGWANTDRTSCHSGFLLKITAFFRLTPDYITMTVSFPQHSQFYQYISTPLCFFLPAGCSIIER